MRRQKDPDEIELLRRACGPPRPATPGRGPTSSPGMTELDVYCGVVARLHRGGRPAGRSSTATSPSRPGPERRGGPPTDRVAEAGDMLILDYSVVLSGYRSDFTNTLVVGGEPTADQQRLYDLCMAGDGRRRAASCGPARRARRSTTRFAASSTEAGVADHFPHHAGHGLGLTHPEAPFFVRQLDETLAGRRRGHARTGPVRRRRRRHPHRAQLPDHRRGLRAAEQPHH